VTGWAVSNAFPPATRAEILHRDPICRCPACKWHSTPCTKPSREADHIIEAADGGSNDPANGQGMCKACHAQKTSKHANARRWQHKRERPLEEHPGLVPSKTK